MQADKPYGWVEVGTSHRLPELSKPDGQYSIQRVPMLTHVTFLKLPGLQPSADGVQALKVGGT